MGVTRLALLLRHGALLLHDLEESFGPERSPAVTMGVFAALLVLPVVAVPGLGLAAALVAGPALPVLLDHRARAGRARPAPGARRRSRWCACWRARIMAAQNPLFPAGIQAVEGRPDARAIALWSRRRRASRTTATSLPAGGRSTEGRALRRRRGASTASSCAQQPTDPHRPQQPRATSSSRRASSRPPCRATSRASSSRRARDRRDALLQPLARPPAAVRVPARAGGALAGGPARPALIAEYDAPGSTRQERLRGGRPGPQRGRAVGASSRGLRDGRRAART